MMRLLAAVLVSFALSACGGNGVGDLSATVQEEKTVPQWIGGIAVLVGAGLVVAGAMRK